MPNERALHLDEYNISKKRYYELKAKVEQYNDWKRILQSNANACESERCKRNINAIETAIEKSMIVLPMLCDSKTMKRHLISLITKKESLTKLQTYYEINLNKNTYYEWRRVFYYELNKIVD